jgi:hypothetical protein
MADLQDDSSGELGDAKRVENRHPHAEAIYRVIFPMSGDLFGVEVSIPESYPTMVTGLVSQQAAEAWIESHKARVAANSSLRRRVKRPFSE